MIQPAELRHRSAKLRPIDVTTEPRVRVLWEAEAGGAGVMGRIDAEVVVPSARRAHIHFTDWPAGQPAPMGDAARAVVDYLFTHCGIHKVGFRTVDTEADAIGAVLACGFVEEGRRRHEAVVDGHWRDHVRTGLLERRWRGGAAPPEAAFRAAPPTPVPEGLPPIPTPDADDFAILRGPRITLRRRRGDDKERFFRWACRPEWWKLYMPEDPDGFRPPTREQFEARWDPAPRPNEWIVQTERGVPLGTCGYTGLDAASRHAEVAYLLYEAEYWRRGYGTEACGLVLRHLLEDLHLHRVDSGTWSGNVGSLRVMLKNGLRVEARGPECYFVDGKWYDGIGTGILAEEYPGPKETI